MKRISIRIATCLMLFISACIASMGQTVTTVNGIRFLIKNNEAIVGRQNKDLSGDIVIPSEIEHDGKIYPVSSIISPIDTHSYGGMSSISADEAAFQGTAITSITLPSTITSISSCAFINCSKLQKVTLPETITSIGWGAFAYCSSLTDINLPSSLSNLSAWCFGGCRSLKNINIPENVKSLPQAAFKNCGFETFEIPAHVKSLGQECLSMSNLKNIKSYIRDITRIYYHDECFGNVSGKTLYIPNGSKFIYQEYNPWRKFAAIEEFDDGHTGEPINPTEVIVTLDSIRYTIYEGGTARIIQQNESLSGDIVIPDSITMGKKTYVVNSIIGPNDTQSWGNMTSISANGAAFQGTAITSITLPSTITSISSCAFINCSKLQKVTLPETITSIGWGAFAYCSSLTDINLPSSLSNLSAWCFAGCRSLKQIEIPKQVNSLPSACFKESGLSFINIHKNINKIGELSLNTNSLSYVKVFHTNVEDISISENAFGRFDNLKNTELLVPKGCSLSYQTISPWINFYSIKEFGFSVNLICNDGGEIISSKTIILDNEEEVVLKIYPKVGFELEYLNINGCDITNDVVDGEYVVSNISENIEVIASFKAKTFCVTFKIGDEVIASDSLEYGAAIIVPEAPEKKGHTFNGWGEVAETVPASDLTYEGSYSVNSYLLTYTVDGDTIQADSVAYGAEIIVTDEPTKEGYTFSGWSEVPEAMPASDVTISGTFTINKYLVTFKIGDEVIASDSLEYGASIVAPETPAKEGHTFSGWGEVAETVPANDVTYEGSYSVNSYLLTVTVDGETVQADSIVYGTAITLPEAPTKEGHTFSGWSEAPETMPASDVTINGTFTINQYTITYIIDGEVFATDTINYGEAIIVPEMPVKEGYDFAWIDEIPEAMPAKDIVINGSYTSTDIVNIERNEEILYIYSTDGQRVNELQKGINIVLQKDGSIRKVFQK